MNYGDFQQVLLWLTGMGAPALVMYLLSWVAENWQKWSLLPHWVKFYSPMILSVALTVGANILLKYPETIAVIQPWFQMLVSAVFAYLASQKAYMIAKSAKYGARFAQPKSSSVKS